MSGSQIRFKQVVPSSRSDIGLAMHTAKCFTRDNHNASAADRARERGLGSDETDRACG